MQTVLFTFTGTIYPTYEAQSAAWPDPLLPQTWTGQGWAEVDPDVPVGQHLSFAAVCDENIQVPTQVNYYIGQDGLEGISLVGGRAGAWDHAMGYAVMSPLPEPSIAAFLVLGLLLAQGMRFLGGLWPRFAYDLGTRFA